MGARRGVKKVLGNTKIFQRKTRIKVVSLIRRLIWYEVHDIFVFYKDLESIALKHLKSILKIEDEPMKVICKVHEKCIAQYTVGHGQRQGCILIIN